MLSMGLLLPLQAQGHFACGGHQDQCTSPWLFLWSAQALCGADIGQEHEFSMSLGVVLTGTAAESSPASAAPSSSKLQHKEVQHADILGHAGAMARADTQAALLSDDDMEDDKSTHSSQDSQRVMPAVRFFKKGLRLGRSATRRRHD
jgi:hypothetical protein